MSTIDLAHASATTLRMLLACCAMDPASPMTGDQRKALWTRLGWHGWVPTPEDTPVPLEVVWAWHERRIGKTQQYVDAMTQKEET